jgi:very-short-patch-repair endonuclease
MDGRPFDRAEAEREGMRQPDVTDLLAEGLLRQPVRGVYLDARVPDDLTSRAACLKLRLPPGAVVGRITAAWLWGVDGRSPYQRAAPPLVECIVPPGCQPLRRPGVRCYTARVAGEVCEVSGIPTTTPVRTALDVLRWLAPHMGLAITDALAAAGLVTPDALLARAADSPGVRGIARARHLARLVEPRTESMGESWLRLRIVDAGFPRPRVQIEILEADGRCVYRLDMGWEDERVAVEYDGEEYHSTPDRLARDRCRRRDLEQTYGWRVLAVGKGEVLGTSLALEKAVGELLSREPQIRRRRW